MLKSPSYYGFEPKLHLSTCKSCVKLDKKFNKMGGLRNISEHTVLLYKVMFYVMYGNVLSCQFTLV